MEEVITTLDALGVDILASRGYVPTGPLGDRHGSWMRYLAKPDASPHRVVSQSFTPVSKESGAWRYEVEVAAGAHAGLRLKRKIIRVFEIPGSDQDEEVLTGALTAAAAFADSLTNADLTEDCSYPDQARSQEASAST